MVGLRLKVDGFLKLRDTFVPLCLPVEHGAEVGPTLAAVGFELGDALIGAGRLVVLT